MTCCADKVVDIKLLDPDAKVPTYATDGSGCFDFYAINDGLVNNTEIFPLGLAMSVPKGHVLAIFSRSGHGFNYDIRLSNCVGIIDSDYRDEIKVKLKADSGISMKVKKGDRIAQGCLIKVGKVEFNLTHELDTTKRVGGFGSTGA